MDIENLEIWRLGVSLAKDVYVITEKFPRREVYCLTDQIRRAAVSVPSNIAEGKGRSTAKDFVHFLNTARGSLYELTTQLYVAREIAYLSEEDFSSLHKRIEDLSHKIVAMSKYLKAKNTREKI
ncbi:30S ribosomal protein S23 [Mesotoga sp. Brook.08.YT.4.2.5.1]|uniref:four helix bundle protein n=1 Tax=unclassified Mesotoga TaxID=1184398 RepID=UPI000C9A114A|nr:MULTISPECIES: four helix bundle protein [unclassified Mesotoga]PNE20257.1 30S ribosomal protein S23 [Mesotoga sp. Brook.08.YT.4.2.5.1]RAO96623.1 S23 ribosomal protein [Mesotoga sp. Brook.08.YT.4.2.5.4.]